MTTVKLIETNQTYPLRIKVLRNGIAERYRFEQDDFESTFHVGAFEKEYCVGIATFIKESHKLLNQLDFVYQLRGMGVDSARQSQGIGRLIIDYGIKKLKLENSKLLWCNARVVAVGFYEKLGFRKVGDPFLVPGIGEHFVMYKRLDTI